MPLSAPRGWTNSSARRRSRNPYRSRSTRRSSGASRWIIRCSSGRPGLARPPSPSSLGAGDILFIDEVHRLRPVLEEFLYPAMEDYRVDVRIADGPHAQTIPMALERFTLIGATTRFGLLTPISVNRSNAMGIVCA